MGLRIPVAWVFRASVLCTGGALIIAARYGYDTRSRVLAAIGVAVLLVTTGLLWRGQQWLEQRDGLAEMTFVGTLLGLLWSIEIGINNVLAPPLPLRDHIDNAFWASIALGILVATGLRARRAGFMQGLRTGVWCGLVSGLIACLTALALIVFGMALILQDPLNRAEWVARQSQTAAPTMAAYFAMETFAGALLHLTLGVGMGGVLGVVGGACRTLVKWSRRQLV